MPKGVFSDNIVDWLTQWEIKNKGLKEYIWKLLFVILLWAMCKCVGSISHSWLTVDLSASLFLRKQTSISLPDLGFWGVYVCWGEGRGQIWNALEIPIRRLACLLFLDHFWDYHRYFWLTFFLGFTSSPPLSSCLVPVITMIFDIFLTLQ